MLRKNKKIVILFMLFLAFSLSTIIVARADSGWDSSYDSGGSWGSGGSWDSGSSWDSGGYYSGGSSFSSSSDPFDVIIPLAFFMVMFMLILYFSVKKRSNFNFMPKTIVNNTNYVDMDIAKIKEIDDKIEIEEFKKLAFDTYEKIQTAWMNFDTDTIRNLTTDELYNMYSSQLTTLKVKKQQNIMKNIEYMDAKIVNVSNENGIITVVVYLNVKCLDYVIDTKTNKTLRGSDSRRLNIEYLLTFVKASDDDKQIEKCPNCGAPVDIVASATCPYCDSVLVKNASNYVLSKKTCIGQKID